MKPTSRTPVSPLRLALHLSLCFAALSPPLAARAHAGWFTTDPTYLGYRIPEHRWNQWVVSADGSASHHFSTSGFGGESRGGGFGGRLATGIKRGYDSDPLLYAWSLSAQVTGNRGWDHTSYRFPPSSQQQDRTQELLSQSFLWFGSVRSYPWRTPIALTAAMDHSLELQQEFASDDWVARNPPLTNESSQSSGLGLRDYRGSISLGTGVGRVRDATPVYQAQVLEARLQRTGALTRPLSDDSRRKLAALFATQSDVGFAHQRPNKYFWRELERVLREDGALAPGSLDAYDVFRLLEPVSVSIVVGRLTGWFVGPTVTVRTLRQRRTEESASFHVERDGGTIVNSSSSSFSSESNDRRDIVFSGFTAELHRPLGPHWQADAASTSLLSEAGEYLYVSSAASTSWIVSDRWLAILRLDHFLLAPGHALERKVQDWNATLSGELNYFLEDDWALRLTATERQNHSRFGFGRDGGVQLGVTYILSGLFEAPGLVGAMRPTPPGP